MLSSNFPMSGRQVRTEPFIGDVYRLPSVADWLIPVSFGIKVRRRWRTGSLGTSSNSPKSTTAYSSLTPSLLGALVSTRILKLSLKRIHTWLLWRIKPTSRTSLLLYSPDALMYKIRKFVLNDECIAWRHIT